jgi:hypothetical protein
MKIRYFMLAGWLLAGLWLGSCASTEIVFLGLIRKEFTRPEHGLANSKKDLPPAVPKGIYKGNSAENGRITGAVVDEGGKAVPFAQVSLKKSDAALSDAWITFEADETGHFLIERIVPGKYQIACMYPQYQLSLATDVPTDLSDQPTPLTIVLTSPLLK